MIIRRLKFLLLLPFIFCYTCGYGQNEFIISGHGQKIKDGDSLFLAYKENGKFKLVSTTAANKRFLFSGTIHQPTKAYISRNVNPAYAEFITESVDVYLEAGKIEIMSPDTLTNSVLSGTPANEILQLFRKEQAKLKEGRPPVKDPDFFTEAEKMDTALVQYSKREMEKRFYEEADHKLAFAKQYPQSYVSLDMLQDLSRINTYIFKVEEVYSLLDDKLKQTQQGVVITERIRKKKYLLPGMKAPDFSLQDNTGKRISLSSFKGKYILIDFWASWCGPCREEHPNLINAYKKYGAENFTIMSISIDTDSQRWIKAITQDKLTWTQVSDLKGDKGEVYLKYGITSIPANFLVDPSGVVVAKDLKGDFLVKELDKIFSTAK